MRTEIDLQSLLRLGDRERAEEAVGIANGEGGDARGTLQRARCSVSHGLAGRDVAHLQDSPGKLDHRRKGIGAGAARLAAIERNAGAHEVVMIGRPSRMPAELARLAGAFGNLARRASKIFRCVSFFGWSGSSAQARWLIISASSKAADSPFARARAATSSAESPSRFMPLSIWMAAGSFARAAEQNAAHSSISAALLSTGRKPNAR